MEKKINDYLHLYLGAEVDVRIKDRNKKWHRGRISEVSRNSNHGDWIEVWFEDVITIVNQEWNESSSNAHTYFMNYDEIKLLLRPLSDMTEEEKRESGMYGNNTDALHGEEFDGVGWLSVLSAAESIKYLISKHFDLFSLIESGLALDKTKLTEAK